MIRLFITLLVSLVLLTVTVAAQNQQAIELYEAGQIAYALFDNEEALEFFTQAIDIDPEYAEAYAHRGEIYRIFIEYDRAQKDFEMAESLDPDNPTVLGHLARWHSHNADNQTALKYADRAIELNPTDIYLYYRRARVYWNMFDYTQALADFEIVMASDEATAGMRSNYGALLNAVGRHQDAVDVALSVIADYPDFYHPHLTVANAYRSLGRIDEAMDAYAQIAIVNSSKVIGIVERANILWTYMGDRESAIAEYEHALELESDRDLVYVNWGVKYDFAGEDQRAKDLYLMALEANPTNADAYYNLGTLNHHVDVEQAKEYYQRAIEFKPRYHQAYLNLGNLLRDQQFYAEAMAMYDLALASFPEFWLAYYQKGLTQELVGGHELAIAEFDSTLAINPTYVPAHYAKGYSYMNLEQYDLAILSFETAVELAPDLAEAYYNLGYIYDVLGDSERAESNYEKARELGFP